MRLTSPGGGLWLGKSNLEFDLVTEVGLFNDASRYEEPADWLLGDPGKGGHDSGLFDFFLLPLTIFFSSMFIGEGELLSLRGLSVSLELSNFLMIFCTENLRDLLIAEPSSFSELERIGAGLSASSFSELAYWSMKVPFWGYSGEGG